MSILTKRDLAGRALALIVTAQFMVILDVAIVNVALPSIKTDLDFSQANLQWVDLRLRDPLRRRAAARRPARRPARTAAALRRPVSRSSPLSSLLCGLAWSEASLIALPRSAGARRRAARPGRALAADDDLRRGTRAQPRARHLRRRVRQRRRGRRPARRRAHLVPELVVGLLHQRSRRRSPRSRSRRCCCARAAPTWRIATSTSRARPRSPPG